MSLNIFFINPHMVTFQALICLRWLLLYCISNVRLCKSQVKVFPFTRKLRFMTFVTIRELKILGHVFCCTSSFVLVVVLEVLLELLELLW